MSIKLLPLLFLLVSQFLFAQQTNDVTRTVYLNNEPVFGADIYIKEHSKGTATNEKGAYTLSGIPLGKNTLNTVSYTHLTLPTKA